MLTIGDKLYEYSDGVLNIYTIDQIDIKESVIGPFLIYIALSHQDNRRYRITIDMLDRIYCVTEEKAYEQALLNIASKLYTLDQLIKETNTKVINIYEERRSVLKKLSALRENKSK